MTDRPKRLRLDLELQIAEDDQGREYPVTDMLDAHGKPTTVPDDVRACVVKLGEDNYAPVTISWDLNS